MRNLVRKLIRRFLLSKWFSEFTEYRVWRKRGFGVPAPHFVKMSVLKKWGGRDTWIETGTFLGDTTMQLATIAESVFTIEPSEKFYMVAEARMKSLANVQVIHGTSEDSLAAVMERINLEDRNSDISFWLDGHFSQGETFRGLTDTPILEELRIISNYLSRIPSFTILVDDVRLFRTDVNLSEKYPSLDKLVAFAAERNLYWTIESDIFVITNRKNC